MAVIPTAIIGNALGRGGRNSLAIHHDWRGTPTGNCAVYVHDSAAYAAREKKPKLNQSLYLLHISRANQNCSSFVSDILKRKPCTIYYLLWFITLLINVQLGNIYYYSTVQLLLDTGNKRWMENPQNIEPSIPCQHQSLKKITAFQFYIGFKVLQHCAHRVYGLN